jgi:low affinity Fe/Cu permease
MDIAKYMLTAVVISAIFKDFENKWTIYVVGFTAVAISLFIGIDMFDKNNKK